MSDEPSNEQSSEDSEQLDDNSANESAQATDQSDSQAFEQNDQPAAQADQPPTESDQASQLSEEEERAIEIDQPTPQADEESTLSAAPSRPYGVESWRPLVTEMAGDIPVEVLLRWIKRESGGNPCATGAPAKTGGGSIENGIFQLYSPDDDHLATPAQLHGSFCSGPTCTRDLTLEEARIQVASGIAQVNSLRNLARGHLKGAGVVWEEVGSDFWSLVKMEHNVPVVCRDYLKALQPASWSEFKAGVLKNPPKQYSGKIDGILSLAEDIGAGAV